MWKATFAATESPPPVWKGTTFTVSNDKISELTCEFGEGPYMGVLTVPPQRPETATSPDEITSN
jgi:hypothetical protein